MDCNLLKPLLKRLSGVPLKSWQEIRKPFYNIYFTSLDSLRVSLTRYEENYLLTVSEQGRNVFSERSNLVEPGEIGNLYERIVKDKERYNSHALKKLQKIMD